MLYHRTGLSLLFTPAFPKHMYQSILFFKSPISCATTANVFPTPYLQPSAVITGVHNVFTNVAGIAQRCLATSIQQTPGIPIAPLFLLLLSVKALIKFTLPFQVRELYWKNRHCWCHGYTWFTMPESTVRMVPSSSRYWNNSLPGIFPYTRDHVVSPSNQCPGKHPAWNYATAALVSTSVANLNVPQTNHSIPTCCLTQSQHSQHFLLPTDVGEDAAEQFPDQWQYFTECYCKTHRFAQFTPQGMIAILFPALCINTRSLYMPIALPAYSYLLLRENTNFWSAPAFLSVIFCLCNNSWNVSRFLFFQ